MVTQLIIWAAAFLVAYLAMGLLLGIACMVHATGKTSTETAHPHQSCKPGVFPAVLLRWPWMAMHWINTVTAPADPDAASHRKPGCTGCGNCDDCDS